MIPVVPTAAAAAASVLEEEKGALFLRASGDLLSKATRSFFRPTPSDDFLVAALMLLPLPESKDSCDAKLRSSSGLCAESLIVVSKSDLRSLDDFDFINFRPDLELCIAGFDGLWDRLSRLFP
jgi:hypothetical protein